MRFLDQTQNMAGKEASNINYETELSALHEMVNNSTNKEIWGPTTLDLQ